MKYLFILPAFLLLHTFGSAQQSETYSFNLQEAITFALDSNYTAINARRDIAKAIKQKWETTASGLPQISADIAYQNNLKQPVTLIPGEIAGGEPGTFVPVTFGTKQNASATATLNQLIFDGSYLVGLQAARAFLDYSENASEKTNLEVRKGVINAYGSVLLSEELIAIFEKNKTTLEKNLFETRKIYENGLTEEESVEQLEVTLLDIETQLNNAQRSASIARQMFNVALGIDVSAIVIFEDSLDQLAQEYTQLGFLDRSLNVEENVDYKIAYNLTEQRSLELKLEKSKALPRISAFLNYGTMANSNDFTFFDNDQRWFQSSVLGVNMNIPIFSSGMRAARTQRAKIALDQAETQLEQTIQTVRLEVNSAKSNYQFAIENYENAKKNLSLAERIEGKNQVKFTEGLSTSFDLRQAQTQLYTAQQQYFQAMLEVINTKANLETLLNTPQLKSLE
ncbi:MULTISPECIES: TolC family protein [Altibacter]|uniref:TolC family protein n=1 Tax=Altibacter TaxID=1535231 RepID=UPI00054EEAD9|nr:MULTISPECIES: TolC family protein [Altibacter]MCW9038281.1 TolC family protein [Altibacter sp.]